MDHATDLDKNTKNIILTTAEEMLQANQPLNREIITHIIKVLRQEKIRKENMMLQESINIVRTSPDHEEIPIVRIRVNVSGEL